MTRASSFYLAHIETKLSSTTHLQTNSNKFQQGNQILLQPLIVDILDTIYTAT